jgi:hypothetical protein
MDGERTSSVFMVAYEVVERSKRERNCGTRLISCSKWQACTTSSLVGSRQSACGAHNQIQRSALRVSSACSVSACVLLMRALHVSRGGAPSQHAAWRSR